MEKLVLFLVLWIGCIAAYIWLVKWVQGRFNINLSGSQNWGAVHLLIIFLFAIPATAILGVIFGITYFVDKKKGGGSGDDIQI